MKSLRDRLETHRKDVLALLEQLTQTGKLHPSSELAGAISNIARAQVLLAEELEYLTDEEGSRSREEDEAPPGEEVTPINGYRAR